MSRFATLCAILLFLAPLVGAESELRAGCGADGDLRALVLEGGGGRIALVAPGPTAPTAGTRAAIAGALPPALGLSADAIRLGPGSPGGPATDPAAAARAIEQAAGRLEPASLRFGRTSLRGLVTSRRGPAGARDEALYAVDVRDGAGGRIAVVALAAARPDPPAEGIFLLTAGCPDQVVDGAGFPGRVEAALARTRALAPRVRGTAGGISIGELRLLPAEDRRDAAAEIGARSRREAAAGGYAFVVARPGDAPAPVPARSRRTREYPDGARVEPIAPASDYTPYRVDRVWLTTRAPSGVAENDRFPVEHYVPKGDVKAAILVLPIWKGGVLLAERVVAGHLAARGYECAILPLPYQFQRAPPGVRSGDWTVSSDLDRTKAALLQARSDVVMVTDWLCARPEVPEGRVGVIGISLGAFVAAVAVQTDPRLKSAVIVMAGGDPASLIWAGSSETRRMKRELEARGVGLEEVRKFFRPLDPAAIREVREYPAFPRYRRVLMISASEDQVVLPRNADLLWRALGKPEIHWFPVTHYTMALKIPEVLALTDRHLDAIFR